MTRYEFAWDPAKADANIANAWCCIQIGNDGIYGPAGDVALR